MNIIFKNQLADTNCTFQNELSPDPFYSLSFLIADLHKKELENIEQGIPNQKQNNKTNRG